MPNVDPWLPDRLAREAYVRKAERRVESAALDYLQSAADLAAKAFNDDTAFLDNAMLDGRDLDDGPLLDTIGDLFDAAYTDAADIARTQITEARAVHAASGIQGQVEYARQWYLAEVSNRLVGVPDHVFDRVRAELFDGFSKGESIPHLADRIHGVLSSTGQAEWKGRATTIARTETIGAYNDGHEQGTFDTAAEYGIGQDDVYRVWQSTYDARTRPHHVDADGQRVRGKAQFTVGAALLNGPGDPSGPASEVINCRCTERFLLPGSKDYPADIDTTGDQFDQALRDAPPPPQVRQVDESNFWRLSEDEREDLWDQLQAYADWQSKYPKAAFANRRLDLSDVRVLSASDTGPQAAAKYANLTRDMVPMGDMNCYNCVTAWDMRMRGYDVIAAGRAEMEAGQSMPETLTRWFGGTDRMLPVFGDAGYGSWYDFAVNEITRDYAQYGDGWGVISVQWKSGTGHIFGWSLRNGKVEFWEPQQLSHVGRTAIGKGHGHWSQVKRMIGVAKIDDLIPSGEGVIRR